MTIIKNLTVSHIVLLCLFSWSTNAFAYDSPAPSYSLDFYTENYAPSSFYHHNELTGISVDTLKLMWKELKLPEQKILVVPWARGYHFTKQNKHAVLFAMSRTPSREDLFQWVGPIFTANYVVVTKKSTPESLLTPEKLFNNSFALIRNDITEELLKKRGATNLISSADMEHAEMMLANDRIDMLAVSISGLRSIIAENPQKANQYKIVCNLAIVGDYFAFNKQIPSEIIKRYQQAFDRVSPKISDLRKKYGLEQVLTEL